MKTLKYIFIVITGSFVFTACEDYEFLNLKRDNPLDGKNNANMQDGVALKFDGYYVYSDNNDDGIINKGETVKLNIAIKNNGTRTAESVKVSFSTTSQYVSNFSPTTSVNFGDIERNSTKWYQYESYYVIQFTVSNTAPANTQIPFNISITDGNGNSFTDSFNVTVSATGATVSYNSYNIYSDNNGDDIINKGETIRMNVSLKNTGTSIARAVKATFSTSSSYVSNLTPTTQVSYGDISANSVKWYQYESYYVIQFTVSSNTPANTTIPFSISIVDESGNTWSTNFNVTVSATGANVSYNSYNVYSDNNNNGIVNKGETVRLNVSLKNTGTSTANSVKSTFSTTSSYISNFTPTTQITYGNISANSVKWYQYESYYVIQFTVSGSTPANTQIPISISIVDESNNTWSSSFNVTVQ